MGILDYAQNRVAGGNEPELPRTTLKSLTGSFASREEEETASRYVDDMYQHLDKIREAWQSYEQAIKRGDMAKAAEVRTEHLAELRMRGPGEAASRQISAINEQIRRVESSRLGADEKRTMLNRLQTQRDRIAERFEAIVGGSSAASGQ